MTTFLRLLTGRNKAIDLLDRCIAIRTKGKSTNVFNANPESFKAVPGAPFSYWVNDKIRQTFQRLPSFEGVQREARQGLATANDFRFVRVWWEVSYGDVRWWGFAKGGAFSSYYSDVYLVVNWADNGTEVKAWADPLYGNSGWSRIIKSTDYYARPGLTWPRRTQQFGVRIMPKGCIFADKGPAAFTSNDNQKDVLSVLALMTSRPFQALVELSLNAGDRTARSYEVGIIQSTPVPSLCPETVETLSSLAHRAWSLKRNLDIVQETSHAFTLPSTLRARLGGYDPYEIEIELSHIQSEIDAIAFDLYSFSEDDRAAMQTCLGGGSDSGVEAGSEQTDDEPDEENSSFPIDDAAGLLSWTAGVSFGRFDWRLATGKRKVPPEPEPFDLLPARSPGMLPDDAEPFHLHAGILVDDEGHKHDLPRLIEQVLETVDASVSEDIRRWLRKEFFPFHLQQYSKSRRKAPIYWPLSTASGSYTLWLYYPEFTTQTLFTAVNDFVEPKLNTVRDDLNSLRTKGGGRSKQEEKELEKLEDLEQELADLRDMLLEIAPGYRPNQDDGVQITAAPLWSLFRHKPWQKVLKDTWNKLEKGDYDWAHLALNYWPDRVLHKCHEDRSLAIAHDVEEQFWEEVEVSVIRRGKETGETKLEWQPKDLSAAQLQAVIVQVRQERSL